MSRAMEYVALAQRTSGGEVLEVKVKARNFAGALGKVLKSLNAKSPKDFSTFRLGVCDGDSGKVVYEHETPPKLTLVPKDDYPVRGPLLGSYRVIAYLKDKPNMPIVKQVDEQMSHFYAASTVAKSLGFMYVSDLQTVTVWRLGEDGAVVGEAARWGEIKTKSKSPNSEGVRAVLTTPVPDKVPAYSERSLLAKKYSVIKT